MENQEELTAKKRTIYYDYLRIFATLAVITLHTAASGWRVVDVNETNWKILNFYNSIVRWGVPAFVMISGSLFLKREISISKIYSKYILRLFFAFVIWSFVYFLFSKKNIIGIKEQLTNLFLLLDVKTLSELFFNHCQCHLWFLPMIIGLYMCIPIIKLIVKDSFVLKYFLLLSFIFWILIPQLVCMVKDFGSRDLYIIVNAIDRNIHNMGMNIVMSYAFYFILGYFLSTSSFNKNQRIIIYLMGLLGFVANIFLSDLISVRKQIPIETYYGGISVFLEATAIFELFKNFSWKREYKFVLISSKWSFGIYLVHVLVLGGFQKYSGLNVLSFSPWLSVPVITLIVFVISFGISALLNHIPIVKKYMV